MAYLDCFLFKSTQLTVHPSTVAVSAMTSSAIIAPSGAVASQLLIVSDVVSCSDELLVEQISI